MKKFVFVILLNLMVLPFVSKTSVAQSEHAGWELSIGGGFMNYYGDLSPYRIQHWSDWKKGFKFFQWNKHYVPKASWGISLEKRITPGIGLMIQANKGSFSMSDRYQKQNGDFDENAPHWDRALNFKTDLYDAGLAFTFHSDNGKLLSKKAFFAPYLFLGAGATYFKVKGDLYDENGNPYNYSDPNVEPDGKYETNLRDLKTERNKKYANIVPYADFGLGIKLRLSKVVSLTVQSDIKYSFSDYLDDVSGTYKLIYSSPEQAYAAQPGTNISVNNKRGDDNGVNDIYIFNKAALQFNLGGGGHRFKAPVVFQPRMNQSILAQQAKERAFIDSSEKRKSKTSEEEEKTAQLAAQHQKKDSSGKKEEVGELKTMLKEMRFDRLEQHYIIQKKENGYRITDLENQNRKLWKDSSLSYQDSLQWLSNKYEIEGLKAKQLTIESARLDLRKRWEQSPIVREYEDSTQIIIYRSHPGMATEKDSLEHAVQHALRRQDSIAQLRSALKNHEETDTLQSKGYRKVIRDTASKAFVQKDTAKKVVKAAKLEPAQQRDTVSDTSNRKNEVEKEQRIWTQAQIDSVKAVRDSLVYVQNKAFEDSLIQVYDEKTASEKQHLTQADSIKNSYLQKIDSLQKIQDSLKQNPVIQKDTIETEKLVEVDSQEMMQRQDSLQRAYDSLVERHKKDSVKMIKQADELQKTAKRNLKQLRNDSLQHVVLKQKIDSLERIKAARQAQIEAADTAKRTIIQRVFKPKKTKTSRAARDSVIQLQRQINNESNKIDQLVEEMAKLKNRNKQYEKEFADLNEIKGLQSSYLRASIDDLNRQSYRPNSFQSPMIAPLVVPNQGGNQSKRDDRIEGLNRRLDSLEAKRNRERADSSMVDKSESEDEFEAANQKALALKHQLDSLHRLRADEKEAEKDKKMSSLQNQLDSLHQQMAQKNKEKASSNQKPDVQNLIEDFPVISTYFNIGSSTLTPKEVGKLRPVASMLKKDSTIIVTLSAFTDATGSARANEIVAQRRVKAVQKILEDKYGVPASRIELKSTQQNKSGSGSNPLDRRVDIKLEVR